MESSPFKSLREWRKAQPWAYKRAKIDGLIGEVCNRHGWRLPRINGPRKKQGPYKPSGYWTKEKCIESAASFPTRSAWSKACGSAYIKAKSSGWLDECCAHMTLLQRPNGYWNFERCLESAKLYQHRTEWIRQAGSAYNKAKQNGWLAQCCAHMIALRQERDYWTKERCISNARLFTTKTAWRDESPLAVRQAKKMGWLDECYAHMEEVQKPVGYWTKERCMEQASRFKSTKDWREGSYASYQAASVRGYRKECQAHMDLIQKPAGYWTKERCIESASSFTKKSLWHKSHPRAYIVAKRMGWFDLCCAHMKEVKKPTGYWTKERCLESAKPFTTRKEWQSAFPKHYMEAIRLKCLDECCAHMKAGKKPVGYWTKERCIESAKAFSTRKEWQKNFGSAVTASQTNGWIKECQAHMITTKKPTGYWTKEKCIESAMPFESRSEWQKSCAGAYDSAMQNGWVDICCTHMKVVRKEWTKEECMNDAKRFTSRGEWQNESKAYQAARRNGWLEECCVHMTFKRRPSNSNIPASHIVQR